MKKILLLILLCSSPMRLLAQESVTFDKNIDKYVDGEIVSEMPEGTLTMQVVTDKSDITKLQLRTLDGKDFDDNIGEQKGINELGYEYRNIDPKVNDEGFIEIQLFKDDKTKKVVRVKVDRKLNNESAQCIPKLPKDTTCEIIRNYENYFGEDITRYTDKTIVYIYDFTPKKREFWKVRRIKNPEHKKGDNKPKYILDRQIAEFDSEKIKPGSNVKFRVINVNRFMFDVSVTDSIVNFESEPPALLKRMLLGDDTLLAGLMDNFASGINSQSMDANQKKNFEELNENVACFIQKYNWLQNKMLDAQDPCARFPCCYPIEYLDIANSLAAIRNKAGKLQLMMEDEKKALAANEKIVSDCKKAAEDLKKKTIEIEALGKEPEDAEEKKKWKQKKEGLEAEKGKLEIQLKQCIPNEEASEKKIAESKVKLLELASVNASVASLPTDAELKQTIIFLRNMVDQNSFYSLDYIPLNGNQLDLWVKVTEIKMPAKRDAVAEDAKKVSADSVAEGDTSNEGNKPDDKETKKDKGRHISIPIIWRPFVNFSSGSFAAIGRNLQEKTYAWQEVGNGGGYMLTESGYTNPAVGFSAFANVEWKAARSFGVGPSVGVGITVEETPKIAYLLGGSFYFGDKHQLAVTAGMAFMQVDKLSKNFRDAAANQSVYAEERDLNYYKEFKAGFFVSLTYTVFNLTKKN